MSVRQHNTRPDGPRHVAFPGSSDDAAALCSCIATSLSSPTGEIIVLRVAGEVDLSTIAVLEAALTDGLDRRTRHLIVDLAALTFCNAWGLTLLVQAGPTAAEHGTSYAVSAVSRVVNRSWTILWPATELPIRYRTAAAGVTAARAHPALAVSPPAPG